MVFQCLLPHSRTIVDAKLIILLTQILQSSHLTVAILVLVVLYSTVLLCYIESLFQKLERLKELWFKFSSQLVPYSQVRCVLLSISSVIFSVCIHFFPFLLMFVCLNVAF